VLTHDLGSLAGRPFLAGGDLNGSLLFDVNNRRQENGGMFNNLRAAGLVDLRPRHFPEEQQAFFRTGSRSYQLDHVFADEQTEAKVTRWRVLTDVADVHHLSDHAPVLIETAD
jgi:endonuclease/exonuclease/phosphatase family metal-dependent hydrolase